MSESETQNMTDKHDVKTGLPTAPGPHKVVVKEHLKELFDLDLRAVESEASLLPLESPEVFYKFLEVEHESDTYIWNSSEEILTGFISLIIKPDNPAMEVLNIEVDPKFHGHSYGKQMMLFAEEVARKAGKEKLWLVTNPKNTRAVGFYQGLGYKIVREAENYYGDGEMRYVLEKELT